MLYLIAILAFLVVAPFEPETKGLAIFLGVNTALLVIMYKLIFDH